MFHRHFRRIFVEGFHYPNHRLNIRFINGMVLNSGIQNPGPQRLGKHQRIALPDRIIPNQLVLGLHAADNHHPVFWFFIIDAVTTQDKYSGLTHRIAAATHDIPKDFNWQRIPWKSNNIQSEQRGAVHGINITQRISAGNGAKIIRIVDDWREKIKGGNEQ